MELHDSNAEKKAAHSRCTCSRGEQPLKLSRKQCILGLAWICAVVAPSMHDDVLHHVEATTIVGAQQMPSFALGGKVASRTAENQKIIPTNFPHHVLRPAGTTGVQQENKPPEELPADHQTASVSRDKQVGEKGEASSVLSRGRNEQEGASVEFEVGHPKMEDASDVYEEGQPTEISAAPTEPSSARETTLRADGEHTSAAVKFSGESGVPMGVHSASEDELQRLEAADSTQPDDAFPYVDVHPSENIDNTLEVPFALESPLSGPLEELYISGHGGAYDPSVHSKGSHRVMSEARSTGVRGRAGAGFSDVTLPYNPMKQDAQEPQSPVADKVVTGVHSRHQSAAEKDTPETIEGAGAAGSSPTAIQTAMSTPMGEFAAGGLRTNAMRKDITGRYLSSQNVTSTALSTETASSSTGSFLEKTSTSADDLPETGSTYDSEDYAGGHITTPLISKDSLTGHLRRTTEKDGQLQDLPSTEDQLVRLLQQAADIAHVEQDVIDELTAEDAGGIERQISQSRSLAQNDPLTLSSYVAPFHPLESSGSSFSAPQNVEDGSATAPDRRMTPLRASANQQGQSAVRDVDLTETRPLQAASTSKSERTEEVLFPLFENIPLSSPPRRAEPEPEVPPPDLEEALVDTEGSAEGGIEEGEAGSEEEPLAEDDLQDLVPEETHDETTGSLPEYPAASDNATDVSTVERPQDAMSETPGVTDPREGACSAEELTALTEYFSNQSESCAAYRCIDEAGAEFLEKIQEHYGAVYEPTQQEELAGLFAACYCRCPMMKCEVDYVMERGSPSCKAATVDYCESSNEKFVQRCTSAAQQLPLLYDLRLDTAGLKVPCRVCRREDADADAATALTPLDGTGEEQPAPAEIDGTTAAPGGSTSSTGTSDGGDAEPPPGADESLLQQSGESAQEGDHETGEEKEKHDSEFSVEEEEEEEDEGEEYDEELPFLQLDTHIPTAQSGSPGSSIEPPTGEQTDEAVVPVSEEQGASAETESGSQGEEEQHHSTPTTPPPESSTQTETTTDKPTQSPPASGGSPDQEGGEPPPLEVIVQDSASGLAVVSTVLLISVAAPIFHSSLPM